MIADDLYKEIATKYPGRFVEISVAEDNENGCSIYYPRPLIKERNLKWQLEFNRVAYDKVFQRFG